MAIERAKLKEAADYIDQFKFPEILYTTTAWCSKGKYCFNGMLAMHRKFGLELCWDDAACADVTFNGKKNWAAIQEVFGLTKRQVLEIFNCGNSFSDVSNRIRKFLKDTPETIQCEFTREELCLIRAVVGGTAGCMRVIDKLYDKLDLLTGLSNPSYGCFIKKETSMLKDNFMDFVS